MTYIPFGLPRVPLVDPVFVRGDQVRLLITLAKSQPHRNKNWTLDLRTACVYNSTSSDILLKRDVRELATYLDSLESLRAEKLHRDRFTVQRITKAQ